MEDVLDLYHEPYDQNRPVICFDETSKALRGHKRDPLPADRERSLVSTPTTNATAREISILPLNR
jgi:hypothetical protein